MATLGASWHLFVYFPYSLTCLLQAGALSRGRERGKSFKILTSEQTQVGPDPEVARIEGCGSEMGVEMGEAGW